MSNIGANLTADKKVTLESMFEWAFIPSLSSMVILPQDYYVDLADMFNKDKLEYV